jgi:hypothetical protein
MICIRNFNHFKSLDYFYAESNRSVKILAQTLHVNYFYFDAAVLNTCYLFTVFIIIMVDMSLLFL